MVSNFARKCHFAYYVVNQFITIIRQSEIATRNYIFTENTCPFHWKRHAISVKTTCNFIKITRQYHWKCPWTSSRESFKNRKMRACFPVFSKNRKLFYPFSIGIKIQKFYYKNILLFTIYNLDKSQTSLFCKNLLSLLCKFVEFFVPLQTF